MTVAPFMSMLGRFRSRFDPQVLASTIAHWQSRVGLRQGRKAPVIRDLVYGEHPRHRMDVFPIAGSNAPMVLFVHGVETVDLPNHNHVSPLMSLGSDSYVVGATLRRFIEHNTPVSPDAPNP